METTQVASKRLVYEDTAHMRAHMYMCTRAHTHTQIKY